jgi:hypothetical protein
MLMPDPRERAGLIILGLTISSRGDGHSYARRPRPDPGGHKRGGKDMLYCH